MKNVKEKVIDSFIEHSSQKLENIVQNSSNQLKVSAAKFMQVYFNFQEKIAQTEFLSQRMQELRHLAKEANESLPSEYNNYLQERKKILSENNWDILYSAILVFQEELNSFLGQQIKTVFVATSGRKGKKQVEIYELPTQNFLKPGISSKNKFIGKLAVSLRKLRDQANGAKKIIVEDEKYFNDLSQTYLEALERYNQLKLEGIYGFYYQIKNQFNIVNVKNKGDMGEAFLNGVLGKKKKALNKNIETNLKIFGGLVIEVDSGSGLLFGDFTGAEGIEYSAKSMGASFLGISQVVSLAQDILSGNIITKNDLKNKQKEYLNRSGLRNQVQIVVDENLQEILKNLKLKRSKV